jgi:hypothetical protein
MTEVANWSVKIYTSWKRYKKLIPAAIGIGALILLKHLDIDLPGFASIVVDWLVGGATVFGVYQIKNEPKKEAIIIEADVTKVDKGK